MAKIRLKMITKNGFGVGEMRLVCGKFSGVAMFYVDGVIGLWNDFSGFNYRRIQKTYKRRLKRNVI